MLQLEVNKMLSPKPALVTQLSQFWTLSMVLYFI
jgi:hypothetical protein